MQVQFLNNYRGKFCVTSSKDEYQQEKCIDMTVAIRQEIATHFNADLPNTFAISRSLIKKFIMEAIKNKVKVGDLGIYNTDASSLSHKV